LIVNLRRILSSPESFGFPAYHPTENILLELLEDMPNAIIFGWFRESIYSVSKLLTAQNISHVTITGDVTDMQMRDKMVQRFQNGDVPYLLGTLASCGQGLNLDITSNIIFIEPDWDPANIQQAVDRAHRVSTAGRTTPLTITTMIIKDTIQEDMYTLSQQKRYDISKMALIDALLDSLRK
jgi:SNF2 family DNA or RNA helicase